jgi:hypothetical protein
MPTVHLTYTSIACKDELETEPQNFRILPVYVIRYLFQTMCLCPDTDTEILGEIYINMYGLPKTGPDSHLIVRIPDPSIYRKKLRKKS